MISAAPTSRLLTTRFVIDCTRVFDTAIDTDSSADVQELLSWVTSQAKRSQIHVYVGGARRAASRKLQTRLQALGCKVGTVHRPPVAA
jgi:DNA-binding MurR/RpiR family transcriptional regulator